MSESESNTQSKSDRIYRILPVATAILLTVGFIFGHSCMPPSSSAAESAAVAGWLQKLFGLHPADPERFVAILRKLAHFSEFALLGGEIAILLRILKGSISFRRGFFAVLCCLPVALVDETIQIFSGRGPMVSDLWIDWGGACFGFLLLALLSAAREKTSKRSKKALFLLTKDKK